MSYTHLTQEEYLADPLQALHDMNKYGRSIHGWSKPGSQVYNDALEVVEFLQGIFPNLPEAQKLYHATPIEERTDEFFASQIMPLLVPSE